MTDLAAIRARHGATRHETVYLGACDTCAVLAALDAAETSARTGVAVRAELKVRLDAALERERRLREAAEAVRHLYLTADSKYRIHETDDLSRLFAVLESGT